MEVKSEEIIKTLLLVMFPLEGVYKRIGRDSLAVSMKGRMTIVLLMLVTVVVSVVAHDVKTISCNHLVRDY